MLHMVTCTADWACILLQIKGGAMTLKSTRGRQGQMVQRQKGEECWRYMIKEKDPGVSEPHLPWLLDPQLVILLGRNTLREHRSICH